MDTLMYENDLIVKKVDYAKSWPGINRNALLTAFKTFWKVESIHYNIGCHLESFDVSRSRLLVMDDLFFSSEQAFTSTALADRMHISRSGMTRCLDGLEKVSYIRRVPSLNNRRTLLIQITDLGRAYVESELPRHYAYFSQVFSRLDQCEQKILIDILSKLNDSTKMIVMEDRP
jgi:DNA-binding MarR family transcriptional regulator